MAGTGQMVGRGVARRLEEAVEAWCTTQARRVRDDLAGGTCWREHCSSGVWRRPWERGSGNREAS